MNGQAQFWTGLSEGWPRARLAQARGLYQSSIAVRNSIFSAISCKETSSDSWQCIQDNLR